MSDKNSHPLRTTNGQSSWTAGEQDESEPEETDATDSPPETETVDTVPKESVIPPEDHQSSQKLTGDSEGDSEGDELTTEPATTEVTDKEQETTEAESTSQFDRITGSTDQSPTGEQEEPDTLTLSVAQVNYTIEYTNDGEEEPIVHVFCRDAESKKPVHVRVNGVVPYFYVPDHEAKRIDIRDEDGLIGKEPGYESIRGDSVTRISAQTPRDVGQKRDKYTHYEGDVLFPDRFLIDNNIKSGMKIPAPNHTQSVIDVQEKHIEPADVTVEPRVQTADIEVNDRNGFPEPEDAAEPVISITSHDSWKDEYTVWYLNSDTVTADIPASVTEYEFISNSGSQVEVRSFTGNTRDQAEAALLDDYAKHVEKTGFDMLTGWNFDDFDAEYLVNRMDYLDEQRSVNIDIGSGRLSRIGEVWDGGWKGGPNIKGRVCFDLLNAYKSTQFTELPSYRLDDVGERELDIGKERFDGDIGDLWESDPQQLIEYNLRDVEICVELNDQLDIINFWDEVRQFVGCRIQNAPTAGDSVDMYVLHKVHGDYVLPSKGANAPEGDADYEGGEVFDPITGVEDMVTVLDLKSLYPMCMCTINASPETKVTEPDSYDGETFEAPNGVHYQKDGDGIIREMVNELLSERDTKKQLRSEHDPKSAEYDLYDRQQGAVKVIMNSLYGVLGWDQFRLYDKDNAAAVTATGRSVIDYTEEVVNDLGFDIAYGDTDSVMISLGDVEPANTLSEEIKSDGPDWDADDLGKLQTAIEQSESIEDTINEAYDDFAKNRFSAQTNRFSIEFEKLYKRFMQAGRKKRYAGHIIWKEGKYVDNIDITGFESERSDIAQITKTAQVNLIEQLLMGADNEAIEESLRELISTFKDGDYSLDKIGIPGGIGKKLDNYKTDTAQVRGAKYANVLMGTDLGQGTKPKRVYLDRVDPQYFRELEEEQNLEPQKDPVYSEFRCKQDVICFIHPDQVPPEFEVAWDKMLNKTLQKPLSRVLKATDTSWDEVKSGYNQPTFEQFM